MKKIHIALLGAGLLLSVISFPLIISNPAEAADNCKWQQEWCGFFHGYREICIVTGDGNTCDCGDVTRPCKTQ